jgi:uncharacterized protein (DUF924 family)
MTRLPASTVTRFWFGYARHELATIERPNKTQLALWFGSKPDDDARIFQTFGAHLRATEAHYSALDDDTLAGTTRTSNVEDLVADIITLDQFTRVIHRKSARAFSNDAVAVKLARAALSDGAFFASAHPLERMFLEMPLMHSEDIDDHVRLLTHRGIDIDAIDVEDESHADFAVKHYCTVKRFGRYPYRNKVLGRENTPEEQAYLDNPHSSYGQ